MPSDFEQRANRIACDIVEKTMLWHVAAGNPKMATDGIYLNQVYEWAYQRALAVFAEAVKQ